MQTSIHLLKFMGNSYVWFVVSHQICPSGCGLTAHNPIFYFLTIVQQYLFQQCMVFVWRLYLECLWNKQNDSVGSHCVCKIQCFWTVVMIMDTDHHPVEVASFGRIIGTMQSGCCTYGINDNFLDFWMDAYLPLFQRRNYEKMYNYKWRDRGRDKSYNFLF